jgi:hypothetical protein
MANSSKSAVLQFDTRGSGSNSTVRWQKDSMTTNLCRRRFGHAKAPGGAHSPNVELRILRLRDHVVRMTVQMRRFLIALCGANEEEADRVMRQIGGLRQRMVLTQRQISHLRFYDSQRN